jgi:hypothetical protein
MEWLPRELVPHRLTETLRALADAQYADTRQETEDREITAKIAECDRKLP